MLYVMTYDIRIGDYKVKCLDSVSIKKSVETLSDTATIYLPGTFLGKTLLVEDKIKVGDPVTIRLGYDNNLVTEFKGYCNSIATDDSCIAVECIDGLYNFKRTALQDRQYKNINVNDLLDQIVGEINSAEGTSYAVDCTYEIVYDKYTVFKATGYDVLKTLQDELKANIYFEGNTLHLHPPYEHVTNGEPVKFDFARNIEKSELKYIKAVDKKIEVEVNYRKPDGSKDKKIFGTQGGEKKVVFSPSSNATDLATFGEQQYGVWVYDGYEGNFTGWMIPYVEPTCKISLHDEQYKEKDGIYYVIATETNFGSGGGSRKTTLGRKLG